MNTHKRANGLPDKTRLEEEKKAIVAGVMALLPKLREGEKNPQFNGKSRVEWSVDFRRNRGASFNPPLPAHMLRDYSKDDESHDEMNTYHYTGAGAYRGD
jgi:hypothetical protein